MSSPATRVTRSAGTRRPRAAGPDPLSTVLLNLAGLGLVLGAWLAISSEPAFDDQITPLNLAVAGAVLVGAGNALYLIQFRKMLKGRLAPRVEALEEGP